MDLSANLPWQAGVVLALLSYLLLHHFAVRPAMSLNPAELRAAGQSLGDGIFHGVWTALAGVLQYIVPLALLIGSLISFVRRRRHAALHTRVAGDPSANALEKMSWSEFEGLAAEVFRNQGYRVTERGGAGPDGGVDLELHMGRDKYLVQCKQWKVQKVGVATVRELYGVMAAEGAVGGFVVSSGRFTEDAQRFALGRSIKLLDAASFRSLVGVDREISAQAPVVDASACPKCGSQMILRQAKRGQAAGRSFWGCSRFPACTGSRDA